MPAELNCQVVIGSSAQLEARLSEPERHQSSLITCRFRRSCTLPLLTFSPPRCLFHIFFPWFPSCLIISITRVTPPPQPGGDLINQVTPPVSMCLFEFKQKGANSSMLPHTHIWSQLSWSGGGGGGLKTLILLPAAVASI